jgi:hypothetical protein
MRIQSGSIYLSIEGETFVEKLLASYSAMHARGKLVLMHILSNKKSYFQLAICIVFLPEGP